MNESTAFALKARFMYQFAIGADDFCQTYPNSTCRYWQLEKDIYDCVSKFPEFKKPNNRYLVHVVSFPGHSADHSLTSSQCLSFAGKTSFSSPTRFAMYPQNWTPIRTVSSWS